MCLGAQVGIKLSGTDSLPLLIKQSSQETVRKVALTCGKEEDILAPSGLAQLQYLGSASKCLVCIELSDPSIPYDKRQRNSRWLDMVGNFQEDQEKSR